MKIAAMLDLIREALFEVAPSRRAEFSKIRLETTINDLALDSIAIMEMVGFIEDRLDFTFEEDELARVRTVGDLAELIGSARAVA